jgi:hypothetical protein
VYQIVGLYKYSFNCNPEFKYTPDRLKASCCFCLNVKPMPLSQVPIHHTRETHRRAVDNARVQDRALAAMSGPSQPTLPITSSIQVLVATTPEGISSLPSKTPDSEVFPSPPILHEALVSDTPTSTTEHSAHWIQDLNIQAGVHQPTYAQTEIAQAMKKLQQGRGVKALDFTADGSDEEDLGVEINEEEMKELRETMQRLMHNSDESYSPWPSKSVCQPKQLIQQHTDSII